jgi:hypothetical protein
MIPDDMWCSALATIPSILLAMVLVKRVSWEIPAFDQLATHSSSLRRISVGSSKARLS